MSGWPGYICRCRRSTKPLLALLWSQPPLQRFAAPAGGTLPKGTRSRIAVRACRKPCVPDNMCREFARQTLACLAAPTEQWVGCKLKCTLRVAWSEEIPKINPLPALLLSIYLTSYKALHESVFPLPPRHPGFSDSCKKRDLYSRSATGISKNQF